MLKGNQGTFSAKWWVVNISGLGAFGFYFSGLSQSHKNSHEKCIYPYV